MKATRTVRMLVPHHTQYGRSIIQGAWQYAREHTSWKLVMSQISFGMPHYRQTSIQADAVLARIVDRKLLNTVKKMNLPTVDVCEAFDSGVPKLVSDPQVIAQTALEHLGGCGFSSFAFCGVPGENYSHWRRDAFEQQVTAAGYPCHICPESSQKLSYKQELRRLARWLKKLPKPIGILTCNDWRGQHVLAACELAGLSVPEEVGILGVDNDTIVCVTCPVDMSSIDIGTVQMGYQAMQMIAQMIQKPKAKQPAVTYGHQCQVINRQSTDLVTDDPMVRCALEMMRQTDPLPTTVQTIIDQLPISRRPFEIRFEKAIGRSPHAELTRRRIALAKSLLSNSSLAIEAIGIRCGYRYAHHFSATFTRKVGVTPSAFRSRQPTVPGK